MCRLQTHISEVLSLSFSFFGVFAPVCILLSYRWINKRKPETSILRNKCTSKTVNDDTKICLMNLWDTESEEYTFYLYYSLEEVFEQRVSLYKFDESRCRPCTVHKSFTVVLFINVLTLVHHVWQNIGKKLNRFIRFIKYSCLSENGVLIIPDFKKTVYLHDIQRTL